MNLTSNFRKQSLQFLQSAKENELNRESQLRKS